MVTPNQDYTKKVEKSITDWESAKTTNILLDTIARHLAVIADSVSEERIENGKEYFGKWSV